MARSPSSGYHHGRVLVRVLCWTAEGWLIYSHDGEQRGEANTLILVRTPIPHMRPLLSRPHLILVTSQRSHLLIPSHWPWGRGWGVWAFQHINFERTQTFSPQHMFLDTETVITDKKFLYLKISGFLWKYKEIQMLEHREQCLAHNESTVNARYWCYYYDY